MLSPAVSESDSTFTISVAFCPCASGARKKTQSIAVKKFLPRKDPIFMR
jgi:hypothetical protein